MISDTSDGYNYFAITPGVQDIIYDNFYIHLFTYTVNLSHLLEPISQKEIYKQEN